MDWNWGSIPEWIAAILGSGLSFVAVYLAWKANKTAEAANLRFDESEQRNEERERRSLAGSLQAWWVAEQPSKRWGVLVVNESGTPNMFQDVEIHVMHTLSRDRAPKADSFSIKVLPPGRMFVPFKGPVSGGKNWELAKSIKKECTYEPIASSGRFLVLMIEFTDQLSNRWQWSPKEGLAKLSPIE